MKLTSISDVRTILSEWNIRPLKTLGQNFLVDANILRIILEAADLKASDEILEIGTGLGVLTEALARSARRVVTVEKDPRLWPLLEERFESFSNVELMRADMMKVDHEKLFRSGINKVAANLPYSMGSAILVNLIQSENPPEQMTVTLQKEVAERMTANPGCRNFGLMAIWSQSRYGVTIKKTISPTCFYPAPGVRSAIISLVRRRGEADESAMSRRFFYALTKFAFARRRKQMGRIFRNARITTGETEYNIDARRAMEVFRSLKIDPGMRSEDLGVETWVRLAKEIMNR